MSLSTDTRTVLLAAIATTAAVGGLAAFAMLQKRFDVTGYGGVLSGASFVLLALLMVGLFWHGPIFHLFTAGQARRGIWGRRHGKFAGGTHLRQVEVGADGGIVPDYRSDESAGRGCS